MRCIGLLSLVTLAAATTAAAQAPVVTPEGDPSIESDSIYALAVDPSAFPDQPFVYLLDDGIIRLEADGRGTRTYRQIVQILTKEAAEAWSEHTFGYVFDRETFQLNWIRVVRPDGSVVSDGPAQRQESSDLPDTEYPIYTDARTIRVTLGGVEPGTIVDFSHTTTTVDPVLDGDFTAGWSVTTGFPVVRSRYIVDVPEAADVRIAEDNIEFERGEHHANGRVTYTWAAQDVAPFEPEPFAGTPNEVIAQITISGPIGWDSIASWYQTLSADRYAVDPAIRNAAAEQLKTTRSPEDTLRALHRWVAQDFRYVSLSLGIGGYRPRDPAQVFETRFGDCKDKATLFIALARSLGIAAHPVIVSLRGEPDSTTPTILQFDHMIAAVDRPGGYLYLDLTAELIPYGEVPEYLQGEMGLVVHPDGRGEVITFPQAQAEANHLAVTVRGELLPDGSFEGWYEQIASGSRQSALRQAMVRPSTMTGQDSTRWLRSMAGAVFPGATTDSFELFEGRDLEATPRIALRIKAQSAATPAGNSYIFNIPIPGFGNPGMIADLEASDERLFPIDVDAVIGPVASTWQVDLTVPRGWEAELPTGVTASSPFGEYRSTYTQRGRVVTITRRLKGSRGLEPKERFGDLIAWFKTIGEDNVRYLAVTPRR